MPRCFFIMENTKREKIADLIEVCPRVLEVHQTISLKIFNDMTDDFLCFVRAIQLFTMYLVKETGLGI